MPRSRPSLKDAIKWEKLVEYQAGLAVFAAETPYDTYLLDTDEDDGNVLRALYWHTFDALQQMGVVLPATFPKELDPKDTLNDTTDTEKHFDGRLTKALEPNPYATLLYAIFKSLTSVSGFNSAYIQELMDDEDLGLDGEDFYGSEFEYCLVYLAAANTVILTTSTKRQPTAPLPESGPCSWKIKRRSVPSMTPQSCGSARRTTLL